MQCHEFETRLNDILDERRAPAVDAQLVDHAGVCPACRGLLQDHEILLEGIAALSIPRPGPDFDKRAVAAALDTIESRSSRSPLQGNWWTLAGLAAVAAAVLVAVVLSWPESKPGERTNANVANRNPQADRHDKPNSAPAVPQTKPGTRAPTPPLAIERLAALPRGNYGRHSTLALGNLAARFPEAVEQLDEVERYAPGIRPIKASFTLLLDALWHTIPGLSMPEEESQTTSA